MLRRLAAFKRRGSTDADDPLSHLPATSIATLARLLRFHSSDREVHHGRQWLSNSWLRRQSAQIADRGFPKELRAQATLPRFLGMEKGLCGEHRGLNASLVGSLYRQLEAEVCVRGDGLRRERSKRPGDMSEEVKRLVDRVAGVATLWMGRTKFVEQFGEVPESCCLGKVGDGGCWACILAAVGGNARVVADLRAVMLSRGKRRRPRLVRMCEAWLDEGGWPGEVVGRLREEGDLVAGEVRGVMRRARDGRGRRGGVRSGGRHVGSRTRSGGRKPRCRIERETEPRGRAGLCVAVETPATKGEYLTQHEVLEPDSGPDLIGPPRKADDASSQRNLIDHLMSVLRYPTTPRRRPHRPVPPFVSSSVYSQSFVTAGRDEPRQAARGLWIAEVEDGRDENDENEDASDTRTPAPLFRFSDASPSLDSRGSCASRLFRTHTPVSAQRRCEIVPAHTKTRRRRTHFSAWTRGSRLDGPEEEEDVLVVAAENKDDCNHENHDHDHEEDAGSAVTEWPRMEEGAYRVLLACTSVRQEENHSL